jgi:hypothetical protein
MRSCLVVLALVLGCSHARPTGPAPRGMIAGVVRDAVSGAGVAEAVITLRRPGELAPVSDRSTGDGTYMIPDLPAGTYQVSAYVETRLVGERSAEVRGGEVIGLDFAVRRPASPCPTPPRRARRPCGGSGRRTRIPAAGVIEGTVADALRQRRVEAAVVSVTRTGHDRDRPDHHRRPRPLSRRAGARDLRGQRVLHRAAARPARGQAQPGRGQRRRDRHRAAMARDRSAVAEKRSLPDHVRALDGGPRARNSSR